MRTSIAILIACGFSASCLAQQQESKTLDRILNPDQTLAYKGQNKKFEGNNDMKIRPYVMDKGDYATKSAMTGEYAGTHSFFGIKNPWLGSKVYETKGADFNNGLLIKNADRKYDVKDMASSKYVDSGKAAPSKSFTTQPFEIGHPTSQKQFDEISSKMSKKLTIDDVRQLLNKNP